MADLNEVRLALIPTLAGRSPSGYIGRTALMKYMYFLQALRGVPLGYRFTLYSYGPFDSDVLADLASAETFNAVKSELEMYSGGYGYKIRPADRAEWLKERASDFLGRHKEDIEWLFDKFGSFSSAELELVGTILFVDREAAQREEKIGLEGIATKVHEVRPNFSEERILPYAKRLADQKLLRGTRVAQAANA